MTDQALLSVPDSCRYLGGIGRTKLYELIDAGELSRIKIGRRTMITRASADDYLTRLSEV